jgi:fluoride ion exporter CrcB/FEX
LITQVAARFIPSSFPYGTLAINLSASFILGFFLTWTSEHVVAARHRHRLLQDSVDSI